MTSITQFGAVGDGASDNAAAFAQAGASGEALSIPTGRFLSSIPLELTNHSATVAGEGPGRSVLERIGGGDILTIDLYADGEKVEARRASVHGFRAIGGVSVAGTLGPLVQPSTKMAVVRDVVSERGGFSFRDCWGLRLDTLYAHDPIGDAYRLSGYCVDSTLTACYAVNGGFHIAFGGWGEGTPEGVSLYNCHALTHGHGLLYDARLLTDTAGTEYLCPWLSIDSCHFNTWGCGSGESSGMTIHRASGLFLTNNLIFHVYPDGGGMFHGVNLRGCAEGRIAGNSIYTGSVHPSQVGIYAGAKALSIADNRLLLTHDGDVGIRVPDEAEDVVLAHNHAPARREKQLYDVAVGAKRVSGVPRDFRPTFAPESVDIPASCVENATFSTHDGETVVDFYLSGGTITAPTPFIRLSLPGVVVRRTQTVGHGWYHGRAAQFLISAHVGERFLRLYTLDMAPWQPMHHALYLGGQLTLSLTEEDPS